MKTHAKKGDNRKGWGILTWLGALLTSNLADGPAGRPRGKMLGGLRRQPQRVYTLGNFQPGLVKRDSKNRLD